ncbi:MAG: chromosome segregation protein SMC [Myxococcales bacterium]|nr:chromosome segregation protein SMC [Myxococcales bacterium]
MKLKRLDIHGFKSFYHRTTIAFDDGVTAIVGPNGCGKSNIVDSIKWVMGEQGAKALRGGAMEDVIFAGSEKRGPMGMCEVRLTFHNDGSAEVPARWREVDEIAIERRLERSRGSDYLVNKQRARLADVQDLIAGTGVGSGPGGQRAYAIIEQGQIGRLVSAKADERRLLIEEAAGITRYRNRRRLAERKMEETRANLERIDDVIGEIERQLKNLRRQALKAQRYKEYRDEARQIALRAATFDYLRLDAERRWLETVMERCADDEADAEGLRAVAETRKQTAALAERSADARARELADRLRAHETAAEKATAELDLHAREKSALTRQLETAHADRSLGAERLAELRAERAEAARRLEALQAESEADAALVAEADAASKAASRVLLDARAEAEGLRRRAAEEAQAIARARAEQDNARRMAMDLRERAAVAGDERAQTEEQRRRLDAQIRHDEDAITAAERAFADAEAARDAAGERRAAHREEQDRAAQDERRIGEAIAADRSRLRSLEELERRREGLGEGVRAVLDAAARDPALAGVVGAVPDALDVPAEYEQAVASVLDARIKGVLVRDADAAVAAVAWLKQRGKGRGLFAAIAADPPPPAPRLPAVDGVRGLLAALMPQGDHPGLLARLLGPAALADDVDAARRLLAAGWSAPVVTRDGVLFDGPGLVVGGADGADPAPLSRRREIKALHGTLTGREAEREAATARIDAAREAAAEARALIDAADRRAQEARVRQAEAKKDLHRTRADLERLAARLRRLDQDAEQLHDRAREAEERALDAAETLAAAEAGRTDRQRAITASEEAVAAAEADRDAAVAALAQIRGRVDAHRERQSGARTALARLDRLVHETEARAQKAEMLREEIEARLIELAELDAAAEQARAEALAAAEERAAELADARAAHADASAAMKHADAELDAARKARDAARDALGEARIALRTCQVRLENAEEKLRDRYQVGLGEVVFEFHQQAPPGPDDRERLGQLEALIEKMGDVNLAAIEEFAEVDERFNFLTGQRKDLTDALADLTQAIDQIDRTSRRLFQETFEAVNEHFKGLFPRMFRGGTAELTLTDPDDMLGTGIEMHVRPPGKKVQNVTLLSGGEKAMCALALVFAVFRHKPSPFCLLDEVDAPLDDANIGRFNEVVREMAGTSQVVLITHNKRTMEIADVLYGITMEESGISKLVGVRMT